MEKGDGIYVLGFILGIMVLLSRWDWIDINFQIELSLAIFKGERKKQGTAAWLEDSGEI